MGASHLPSKSLHDNSAGKTRIWFVVLKPINYFVIWIKDHYNFMVQNIISPSWFKLFRCWIEFWKSQREHQTYDNISLGSAKLWRFPTQRLFYKACYILIFIKFLLFCFEKVSHISNFMPDLDEIYDARFSIKSSVLKDEELVQTNIDLGTDTWWYWGSESDW